MKTNDEDDPAIAIPVADSLFTYVVDSSQKLANWSANIPGNDYSSVLIAKGTWNSNNPVNLTNTGTKVVVGAGGSLLTFNGFTGGDGLKYSQRPTSGDYWMEGVNVQVQSNEVDACAFRNCINLTNCMGSGESQLTADKLGVGFYECENLVNCRGIGIGNDYGAGANGAGFYLCKNLSNCTGQGTVPGGYDAFGFYQCTNLNNCVGNASTDVSVSYGFFECTRLTNCIGSGSGGTNGWHCGFYRCTDLTQCIGTGSSGGDPGGGFFQCTNLLSCKGIGYGSEFYGGYGFYECNVMFGCAPSGTSTTATYYSCYMATNIPVGNTATGGYNRPT